MSLISSINVIKNFKYFTWNLLEIIYQFSFLFFFAEWKGESANEVDRVLTTRPLSYPPWNPSYWLLVTLNFQQHHFVLVEWISIVVATGNSGRLGAFRCFIFKNTLIKTIDCGGVKENPKIGERTNATNLSKFSRLDTVHTYIRLSTKFAHVCNGDTLNNNS